MEIDRILDLFSKADNKEAFIHNDVKYSYKDIVDLSSKYSLELINRGFKTGDLVVVNADYSPQVFCFLLALSQLKCIAIPFSSNSIIESSSALSITGADWIITNTPNSEEFLFKQKSLKVRNDLLDKFLTRCEPGIILFSSGSSGKPKAILHSFEIILSKYISLRSSVKAIPFLMIDHFGGINTILGILCSLGTVVTVENRSVESICKAIEKYKVELLPTTPSFLAMLLASGLYKNYDLSSLEKITYGTEVMPQSTLDKLKLIFPNIKLQQTYGLSEVGVMQSKSREDGSLWVKLGGKGFETKVVKNILWVRSKYSMVGYLNSPNEFDTEGWFNTQDLVDVDGDYFRINGRVSDIINVGGQKVYPAEVENIILGLENIKDVSIYGESHPFLGNIVVAKVQLIQDEDPHLLKLRIRKKCIEQLSTFKVPVKVYVSREALYSSRQKKIRSSTMSNK
jgi:acyl-CoA synthetase (AMP-forming)/AMP-acid ligase II